MAVQNSYNNTLRDGLKVALTGSSAGDIFYRAGNGAFTRLGVGSAGQVLKVSNANLPVWSESITNEDIQDVIGAAFISSPSIDFVYDDDNDNLSASIASKSVSNALLRDSVATSLMGRSANTAGVVGDIAFTADGQVLMRADGVLAPISLHDSVVSYRVDEFAAPTSAVSFSGQRITNLAAPIVGTDAANKVYVDNALQGVPYKSYVRTATAANVDLAAPGPSIGGIVLSVGQNFLLYGQADATENGVYTYVDATTAATRRSDLELVPGMTIFVDEGAQADTTYQLTSNGPITVGASDINFTIFGRVESITVSSPLVRVGNDIAISDNGITPAYLQQFPARTLLGNIGSASADASYLTPQQVVSLLGLSRAMIEEYVVTSNDVTTVEPNKVYRPNNSEFINVFELPSQFAEGDTFSIEGYASTGWTIVQKSDQSIVYGDESSAVGIAGHIDSIHYTDVIKLRCIEANTKFQVIYSIGNMYIN